MTRTRIKCLIFAIITPVVVDWVDVEWWMFIVPYFWGIIGYVIYVEATK